MQNQPNRATNSIQTQLNENPSQRFCSSKCRVCQSENLPEIHRLRSQGLAFHELAEQINKLFNESFSKDALWRHFKKYGKTVLAVSAEKMLQEFDEKTQSLALHQKQTLFVMDKSFQKILEHIEAGTITPTISEWLQLQKHYYQVLEDPNHGVNDDVIGIFQRAAEKHGFSLDQAVLIKSGRRATEE